MNLCLSPHDSNPDILCALEAGHAGDHTLPSPGNATAIRWPRADAATLRQVEVVLEDIRRQYPEEDELFDFLSMRIRGLT